jgi:hypothetical protein
VGAGQDRCCSMHGIWVSPAGCPACLCACVCVCYAYVRVCVALVAPKIGSQPARVCVCGLLLVRQFAVLAAGWVCMHDLAPLCRLAVSHSCALQGSLHGQFCEGSGWG